MSKPTEKEMLNALKAQHKAIDQFAMLIESTPGLFLPSTTGAPWDALVMGNEIIKRAEGRDPRYNWKSTGPGGCDSHNIEHPCGKCLKEA